jgi:hypothetical protein
VKRIKVAKTQLKRDDVEHAIPGGRVVGETSDALIVLIQESDVTRIVEAYNATEDISE